MPQNKIKIADLAATGTKNSTTFLRGDDTFAVPSGGGSPGGSNTQIQFNDSSAFGGDAGLTYSKTNDTLTITTDTSGNGLVVSSTKGAGAGTENLVVITATNSAWDRPLLRINDTSASGGAANIRIDSPNPDIEFVETDQTTPAGKFEIAVNSDKFQINGRSAADSQFEPILTAMRYGSGGMVGIGTQYDTPNAMLEIVHTATPAYDFAISSAVGGTSGNIFRVDNTGNLIVNDRGDAVSTRIEGDTDANLFYIDGTSDRVGVGLSSGLLQKFHVKGRAQFGLASNTSGTIDLANSGAAGLTRLSPGAPASDVTLTFPAFSGTVATLAGTEALTNKSVNGVTLTTGGGTTNFLRADGAYAAPPGGGSGLTVGSTAVSGGTSGRVLYDNAGVLGQLVNTGTGNNVLATAPSMSSITLAAGTATSGTAPLYLTSGTSLTTPVAGALEYTTDDLFLTISTGAARKRLLMAQPVGGLTTNYIPYVGTNGRLDNNANLQWNPSTARLGVGAVPNYRLDVIDQSVLNSGVMHTMSATQTLTPTTASWTTSMDAVYGKTTVGSGTAVASDAVAIVRGGYFQAVSASNNAVNSLWGVTGAAQTGTGATGTINSAYGIHGYIQNDAATINNAFGSFAEVRNVGSGTINSAVGLYVDITKSAGTITTATGFKMIDFSGTVGTQYGVLTFGKSKFGDFTALPTALLEVSGSTTAAASFRINSGTAPTSPNNGDIWFDGTDIKMRIGGVTKTFTLI